MLELAKIWNPSYLVYFHLYNWIFKENFWFDQLENKSSNLGQKLLLKHSSNLGRREYFLTNQLLVGNNYKLK
jgi:hypothetical protein